MHRERIVFYEDVLEVPESVREKYGRLAVVYWRRKDGWGEGENVSVKNFLPSKKYERLREGAERIKSWIDCGEKIGIVADYDADGITSASIFYRFLKEVKAKASFYIPERSEGYGVSRTALKTLKENGCSKIIVLDSGTSFNDVLKYGKELGLEIVVIDHHEEREKTENAFLINPKAHGVEYFKDLCTAGLSFYTVGILNDLFGKPLTIAEFLELASVGTVADVVPLTWINRLIVGIGIREANKNGYRNKGLQRILELNGLEKVDEDVLGWIVAPRINAASRVSSPLLSFKTLTSSPESAEILEKLNRQRQYLTRMTYEEAVSMPLEGDVLFLFSPNWHKGVVGIVAGRIARLTGKITFVGTLKNGIVTLSGRNPTDANLVEVMKSAAPYLEKFGGHAGAGGITVKIENVERVVELMSEYVRKNKVSSKPLEVDARIPLFSLTEKEIALLRKWAPYGEGNPKPLFYDEVNVIKKNGTKGYLIKYLVKGKDGKVREVKSAVPLKEGAVNRVIYSAHKGTVLEERVD